MTSNNHRRKRHLKAKVKHRHRRGGMTKNVTNQEGSKLWVSFKEKAKTTLRGSKFKGTTYSLKGHYPYLFGIIIMAFMVCCFLGDGRANALRQAQNTPAMKVMEEEGNIIEAGREEEVGLWDNESDSSNEVDGVEDGSIMGSREKKKVVVVPKKTSLADQRLRSRKTLRTSKVVDDKEKENVLSDDLDDRNNVNGRSSDRMDMIAPKALSEEAGSRRMVGNHQKTSRARSLAMTITGDVCGSANRYTYKRRCNQIYAVQGSSDDDSSVLPAHWHCGENKNEPCLCDRDHPAIVSCLEATGLWSNGDAEASIIFDGMQSEEFSNWECRGRESNANYYPGNQLATAASIGATSTPDKMTFQGQYNMLSFKRPGHMQEDTCVRINRCDHYNCEKRGGGLKVWVNGELWGGGDDGDHIWAQGEEWSQCYSHVESIEVSSNYFDFGYHDGWAGYIYINYRGMNDATWRLLGCINKPGDNSVTTCERVNEYTSLVISSNYGYDCDPNNGDSYAAAYRCCQRGDDIDTSKCVVYEGSNDYIEFTASDCEPIPAFRSGGSDTENGAQLVGPDDQCLSTRGDYGYGVDEELIHNTCDAADDNQIFWVYEENGEYKIRPKKAAQNVIGSRIDVCVTTMTDPYWTAICGESNTVIEDPPHGRFRNNFDIFQIGMVRFSTTPGTSGEVFLVNAAGGSMRLIHLNEDPLFGYNGGNPSPRFEEFSEESSFMISTAGREDHFILRPKQTFDARVDVCLAAGDPLTVASCVDGSSNVPDNVKWMFSDGRIRSVQDTSRCITHDLISFSGDENVATSQACGSDPKSFVSVLPKEVDNWTSNNWGTLGSANRDFPQILNLFPRSGIQLAGGTTFRSVKVQPSLSGAIALAETLVLEFKFVIDSSAGTSHRVCLVLDDDSETCFRLSGSLGDENENVFTVRNTRADGDGVVNEYIIKPLEEMQRRCPSCSVPNDVEYIRFEQTGDTETRSRFYSIEIYDRVAYAVEDRSWNKLTLTLDTVSRDTSGLHFAPSVLVQEEDGNYHNSITAAERRVQFNSTTSQVTVENLNPGRRYLIRLDPVDSAGAPFDDEKRTIKAFFKDWTSCSCDTPAVSNLPTSCPDNREEEEEETGAPRCLTIDQSGGLVKLSFYDYSVCEEAYAFTRQQVRNGVLEEISYAPNYFYYSVDPCTEELVVPSAEYSDMVSNLEVGQVYTYCVNAIAQQYIVDYESTRDDDGTFLRRSTPTCVDHTAQWESEIIVKVKTRRQAGSHPANLLPSVDCKLLSS